MNARPSKREEDFSGVSAPEVQDAWAAEDMAAPESWTLEDFSDLVSTEAA